MKISYLYHVAIVSSQICNDQSDTNIEKRKKSPLNFLLHIKQTKSWRKQLVKWTIIKKKKKSPLNFVSVLSAHPGITTSVTTGLPIVRVPVLSNTMVLTIENLSNISPPRHSIPLVAPNEVPTWKMFDVNVRLAKSLTE